MLKELHSHRFAINIGLLLVVGAVLLGGTAMVSEAILTTLDAPSFNSAGSYSTPQALALTEAPSSRLGLTAGFKQPITNLSPGDSASRYIDIKNVGTLSGRDMSIQVKNISLSSLTSYQQDAIKVSITQCPTQFTPKTGDCPKELHLALAQTPLSGLTQNPKLLLLPQEVLIKQSDVHLRFNFTIPDTHEVTINGKLPTNTLQGIHAEFIWTFNETQVTTSQIGG